MQFDFKRFYEDHNIEYWTEGKNVQEDWININCPFCPDGDPSNHGGGNPYGGYYHCWRCGSTPLYDLIEYFTDERPYMVKKKYSILTETEIKEKQIYTNDSIVVPGTKLNEYHKKYLKEVRKFDPDYLEKKYDLRGTGYTGREAYRIIIPLYYKNRIVSWEARDYTDKQELKSVPCLKENEIIPHNDLFFNLDNVKGNDKIIVCEGAFDAMRLGDGAVSCYTSNLSPNQLKILSEFKEVYFIFDSEEIAQKKAQKYCVMLNSLGVYAESVELTTADDPAELTDEEAKEIKRILGIMY